QELDRVHGKGFRAALIRPAFYKLEDPGEARGAMMMQVMANQGVGGQTAGPIPVFAEDQPFRPIFDRCSELGVVVCIHPSSNITGPDAVSSGGFAERVSERVGVHHSVAEPIAYMQDADLFMTTAFFHGLFEDLPELRL